MLGPNFGVTDNWECLKLLLIDSCGENWEYRNKNHHPCPFSFGNMVILPIFTLFGAIFKGWGANLKTKFFESSD